MNGNIITNMKPLKLHNITCNSNTSLNLHHRHQGRLRKMSTASYVWPNGYKKAFHYLARLLWCLLKGSWLHQPSARQRCSISRHNCQGVTAWGSQPSHCLQTTRNYRWKIPTPNRGKLPPNLDDWVPSHSVQKVLNVNMCWLYTQNKWVWIQAGFNGGGWWVSQW